MIRWSLTLTITLLMIGCAPLVPQRDLHALALWAPWSPPLAGHAARQSTWDTSGGNADSLQIAPGETEALLDVDGPGIVRHIWITTNAFEPGGRTIVLRMFWDGDENPAVEVPLGDFFAVGHGADRDVHSFPISVNSNGHARNCWWPMPFSDGARITVTNEGPETVTAFYCYVEYLALDDSPPTRERFHAQYRQAYPTDFPENYVILETEGQGQYVGTVYSIESTEPNWWGEGDDLIEVDGHEPLRGTGTEDYLCDAWGMRVTEQLWHGTTICEGYDAAGLRTTAYRWHILDPIPFQEHIRVSIEHGHANDRQDHMSSVAIWYQFPTASPFPKLPPVIDRLEGRVTQRYIRSQAYQLATGDDPEAAEKIEELLSHADDVHTLLIDGLLAYTGAKEHPTDEAVATLDEAIAELEAIIEALPEEERFTEPTMDLPTDSDAPVPSMAVVVHQTLQRVRHDLARRLILARGHLEPGDEILLEVRGPDTQLMPPPAFESTEDWTYSYAKVEDIYLMGRGAHFTYGDTDPSWARFTPDFPQGGCYEVSVIFSYGANSSDTRWEVRHADGMETIPMEQRGRLDTTDRNNAVWHSLGTFRFEAGQSVESGSITLNVAPGIAVPNEMFEHRAYIDSVRLIYSGDQ
jgi:D-arabinan exo alpha-(1,3)/(1,5)-arabinofuranosidase (non-reducing end)